jgi:hypothetical protein
MKIYSMADQIKYLSGFFLLLVITNLSSVRELAHYSSLGPARGLSRYLSANYILQSSTVLHSAALLCFQ